MQCETLLVERLCPSAVPPGLGHACEPAERLGNAPRIRQVTEQDKPIVQQRFRALMIAPSLLHESQEGQPPRHTQVVAVPALSPERLLE
jgi:hypothetical protein